MIARSLRFLPSVPMHLLVTLTLALVASDPVVVHVAPDGRDDWSGALAEPSDGGDDGPFATVARAQLAAREARARGEAVHVVIAGGVYELEAPLVFTPEDSGSTESPVVYRGREGERPVLSGGRRIEGWEVGEDGRWRAELGSGARPSSQLFVDDQRRFRSRLPSSGYYHVDAQVEPSADAGRGHDRFGFARGDIDPSWRDLADVEVLAFHTWSTSRMRIASIDADESVVTFTGSTRTRARPGSR